jgi:hypothetical protein
MAPNVLLIPVTRTRNHLAENLGAIARPYGPRTVAGQVK